MIAPVANRSLNRTSNPYAPWYHVDILLALATVALAAFGLAAIYSATRGPDPEAFVTFYVERQIVFLGVGALCLVLLAAIPYDMLRHWAWTAYGVGLFALLAVLAVGDEINGARAWFNVGSFGIQPSEFLKLGLIVALAAFSRAS